MGVRHPETQPTTDKWADTLRKLGGRLSCRLRLSNTIVPSCMPLGSTSFCTESQIVVEPNIKLNK
jgi:hypothetical protein